MRTTYPSNPIAVLSGTLVDTNVDADVARSNGILKSRVKANFCKVASPNTNSLQVKQFGRQAICRVESRADLIVLWLTLVPFHVILSFGILGRQAIITGTVLLVGTLPLSLF